MFPVLQRLAALSTTVLALMSGGLAHADEPLHTQAGGLDIYYGVMPAE